MPEFVLVHGAWHGSWCWADVADALAERGHRVTSVTLPGHSAPGRRERIWNRIGEYVDAVVAAVETCSSPPILVGHSMGGYVVQRYLESRDTAAGVLVASVPARGALAANLRTLRAHPGRTLRAMVTADYLRLVDDPDLVRELFFTADTPAEIVDALTPRLQNESAFAINTMVFRPPQPTKVATPVHVIAAEGDTIFTLDEQHHLAAAYGTEAVVLSGGHDIMLDTSWPELVDQLDRIAG
ncbi:MAG: alpha/beta fold hydrolase [Actinomycetota bacterium]